MAVTDLHCTVCGITIGGILDYESPAGSLAISASAGDDVAGKAAACTRGAGNRKGTGGGERERQREGEVEREGGREVER